MLETRPIRVRTNLLTANFWLAIATALPLMTSACSGGGAVLEDPLLVTEFDAQPRFRCPGEDVRVRWQVNLDDKKTAACYDRGVEIFVRKDADSKISIYETDDNMGEIVLVASEIEAAFGGPLPAEIVLICQPKESPGVQCMTNSEREAGQLEVTIQTIYGQQWVSQNGVPPEGAEFFRVRFEPLVWSDSLRVSEIRLVQGCQGGSPSGTYVFDKGLETANFDRELSEENNYEASFVNTPVQLIEDWVVSANPDTGCRVNKDESIEVEFLIYCPTN